MAVSISVSQTTGTAPHLVVADCSATTETSESLDTCFVQWTFNDAAGIATTSETGPVARLKRPKGVCRAHVYEVPGSYALRCDVTSPSDTGQATSVTMTINAFSGTTRYVSSAGNDANPGTEDLPWLTFDRAMQELRDAQEIAPYTAVPFAIYFRRGDTFTTAATVNFGVGAFGKVIVGAYGPPSGARPVITYTGASGSLFTCTRQPVDHCWIDLDFVGAYDIAAGTGNTSPLVHFPHSYDASYPNRANWFFLRCRFRSCYQGVTNSAAAVNALPQMRNLGLVDCTIEDAKHLHFDLGGQSLTVAGGSYGGKTLAPDAQAVGIGRIWWAKSGDASGAEFLTPHQSYPALEVGAATDASNPTEWLTVYHSEFYGGQPTVGLRPIVGGDRITHVCFDRCFFSGAEFTFTLLNVSGTDVTVRSCIFGGGDSYSGFVRAVDAYDWGGGALAPARIKLLFNGFGTSNANGAMLLYVSHATASELLTRGNMMIPFGGVPAASCAMFFVDASGFSLSSIDDAQDWLYAPGCDFVSNNGVRINLASWKALGHADNSREAIDPGIPDPGSGAWVPNDPQVLLGANKIGQVWEDHFGALRDRDAPAGKWSYGPRAVRGAVSNQTMIYEWATVTPEMGADASLSVKSPGSWRADSVSVSTSVPADARLRVSTTAIEVDPDEAPPAAACTVPQSGVTLVSVGGVSTTFAAGEQSPGVLTRVQRDASLSVGMTNLAASGTTPSVTATAASSGVTFVVVNAFAWECDEGSPEITTSTGSDQIAIVRGVRTGAQRGPIHRVVSRTKRYEYAKPEEVTIYAGMALSRVGEFVLPLKAGEPFTGFAAENSVVGDPDVRLYESGFATLEVVGVTGKVDTSKVVYASSDAAFTLTSSGNSAIGRIAKHVYGRTVLVKFEADFVRSL